MSHNYDRWPCRYCCFIILITLNKQHIIITMMRSWLIKFLLCFPHIHHSRRKQQQQQKPTSYFMMKNQENSQTDSLCPSICHTFSSPLKISTLQKVRCRIQSRTLDKNLVTLPLSMATSKQQPIASFLNESQNCPETLRYEYKSSITRCKRHPSLIAIDIGNNEFSQERALIKHMKQSMKFYSLTDKSKSKNEICLRRQSLIKLSNSDNSLAISSHYSHHHRNQTQKCLSLSTSFIRKQTSDSIIFVHRHRHATSRQHYSTSKQRSPSNYSPHNTNSITYDSPLSDTTINTPNSDSDVFTPVSQSNDKTWRLKIHDDLNKDGSRHFVMHKGSQESIRKRRENKRAKRSEEKKRRIEENILKANQRWQKYSNIDYELVFFISRYYDQLPLCSNCRNYFITHQTQFLADDPRASLDYAADAILQSQINKTMTMKQAAKSRLIQDYDKQTDIIFNLCDICLPKCEQIRNELKQINFAKKMSNQSNSPNINIMTPDLQQQQQQFVSPSLSPNVTNIDDHLFSPSVASPILPSPVNTHFAHQPTITSTPPQNTITDLDQIYLNNLIQNHQIKLQQLYQQSQNIIVAQQYQQNYPLAINQQQLHYDLQSCIRQMQYHCLEILHLQYPGYSLSFPYTPSYNPQCLSYRYQQIHDESIDTESSSILSEEDNDDRKNMNTEDENDTTVDDNRCYPVECDQNQQSNDDRLTIETCHGLVEYCNAPLDDFIRGLQVLKCLSNFNCYSS